MNYEEIKKLMEDMGNSKLDSLDIEFPEGIKISMKKNENDSIVEAVPVSAQNTTQVNITEANKVGMPKLEENLKIVTSPMVGTFYASASPKEKAFVSVGDKVKKGDVLCIVEAMKLMNEIESEYDGEIVEILVNNKEMVDFGKPLFKLK